MGRHLFGEGGDPRKLRTLFYTCVGAALGLTIVSFIVQDQFGNIGLFKGPRKESSPQVSTLNTRTYRGAIKPNGSTNLTLSRIDIGNLGLVDMNDRGDYLFLEPPSDLPNQNFIHKFNGKSALYSPPNATARLQLTTGGKIVERRGPMQLSAVGRGEPASVTSLPFSRPFFRSRPGDDGSEIRIQFESIDHKPNYFLLVDKQGLRVKTMFTSSLPIELLETDPKGSIFMRQRNDSPAASIEILLSYKDGKVETIPMPSNYFDIDRITSTGKQFAGTFGSRTSVEPMRSFRLINSAWSELPIPTGFEFSYVQKVFEDGLILGFVSDKNQEKTKQVIWDGDKVAILNDMPAWPKLGQFSFVSRATRRGDIYVRNVLNTESGAGDNYLLHVARN